MTKIIKFSYLACRSILGRFYSLLDHFLWARWPRIAGAHCEGTVRCIGMPRIRVAPGAEVGIGSGVFLASRKDSNPLQIARSCSLTARAFGKIKIGAGTSMSGVVIVSDTQIEIGKNVMIGANVTIIDTDFHPLNSAQRRKHPTKGRKSKPVSIGNDVFVGAFAVILKGTEIGEGCVIGACSVVAGKFPSRTVIAGNPATVIRTLENHEDS